MSQPMFILAVIGIYFAVWMVVSWLSSKGADNSTFFSGNRKMAWPLVAIAMLGAPISGVTFVSVPGMVASKGYSYLQMGLGFIVGYLIIALVLIPLYFRLNIVSVYQFLERRFGQASYKTGAWLFFISKILGISIRFLMVCAMLQFLVFDPLGISYIFSVAVSLALIWVSTFRGGVKSVIWGDVLKSFCLIMSIVLCLYFMLEGMGLTAGEAIGKIADHPSSRIIYADDPSDAKYFWKQFVAGVVLVVAMTGLDQDMMQRTLACRNAPEARKNMVASSLMQFATIFLLLALGTVMVLYMEGMGENVPEKTDNLFATVAFHEGIPLLVGALFVLGLVSATYSSVASALTSMTTTMTVDILDSARFGDSRLQRRRTMVHSCLAILMGVLVTFFYYLNKEDAISMVYTLVSYTDGPILGLFVFGILTRREVEERWLPVVCLSAPVVSWGLQWGVAEYFHYDIGYELILLNAGLTYCGMLLLSRRRRVEIAS